VSTGALDVEKVVSTVNQNCNPGCEIRVTERHQFLEVDEERRREGTPCRR
jgi:hypothetical protein